jgi:hypothetical protein
VSEKNNISALLFVKYRKPVDKGRQNPAVKAKILVHGKPENLKHIFPKFYYTIFFRKVKEKQKKTAAVFLLTGEKFTLTRVRHQFVGHKTGVSRTTFRTERSLPGFFQPAPL